MTSLLVEIEKRMKVPISTLKLNTKILRNLGLVEFGQGQIASLTSLGKIIARILFEEGIERLCMTP